MKQFFCHLFLPHHSNNHRAKVFHHSSLVFLIIFFLLAQFTLPSLKRNYPQVLGTSIDLSVEKILELTNKEREEKNLPPLTLNTTLSQIASMKADYMFEKNFWAHDAPDGTTPWYFFKKAGYNYTYAGENLARGFTDSSDVVAAWMNSPTHRDNMLSPHYKEIGFSIKKGKLLGEDTILIVESFGSRDTIQMAQEKIKNGMPNKVVDVLPAVSTPLTEKVQSSDTFSHTPFVIQAKSIFDSVRISSSIGIFILGLFIFLLVVDIMIIERKKIARVVGHNADHIFFFSAVLIIMIFSLKGLVL